MGQSSKCLKHSNALILMTLLILLGSCRGFFHKFFRKSPSPSSPITKHKHEPQAPSQSPVQSDLQRKLYPFDFDAEPISEKEQIPFLNNKRLYLTRNTGTGVDKKNNKPIVFTKDAEMLNARLAMIGLFIGLMREELTGETLIQQLMHL